MRTKGSAFLAFVFITLISLSCSDDSVTVSPPGEWPVIRSYDMDHLCRIALPLGGIGTGTVSLAGNGELKDWRLSGMPLTGSEATGDPENAPFFSIYARTGGSRAVVKALAGPACAEGDQNRGGDSELLHGLPRFANASFDAAFPFGQVHLSDDEMPVDVTIRAFNPMVPGEPEVSGLPVAALYFEVRNKTMDDVIVSVCGTMRNFIGGSAGEPVMNPDVGGIPEGSGQPWNEYIFYRDIQGIYMSSGDADIIDPARRTMALSTAGEDTISWRTGSEASDLAGAIKEIRDDFSSDGELTELQTGPEGQPFASLAFRDTIGPGRSRYFRFIITWHFPVSKELPGHSNDVNFYTGDFTNAWDVTKKIIPYMPLLEENSVRFVRTLMASNLPQPVLEAALFNLSGLRSPQLFRTADGKFRGWEGSINGDDPCQDYCTTGWNNEQAMPFLFGRLARSMREIEFDIPGDSFTGTAQSVTEVPGFAAAALPAADFEGQLGAVMRFYRDWQLSGDSLFLTERWGRIKSVITNAWTAGGPDHDRDGVIDRANNGSSDAGRFQADLQTQIWYLGALRAANEMSKAVNDSDFTGLTDGLFRRGSEWTDDNMLKRTLGRTVSGGQMAGRYMADICGLGNLFRSGTRIKTEGRQPGTESGHEYITAAGMFLSGKPGDGLKILARVQSDHDGLSGNPFGDPDCLCRGVQSMAAWTPVIALTRFRYSAVDESFQIRSSEGVTFWSNGYAWGECVVTGDRGVREAKLKVFGGELRLRKIILDGFGERIISDNPVVIRTGEESVFSVIAAGNGRKGQR